MIFEILIISLLLLGVIFFVVIPLMIWYNNEKWKHVELLNTHVGITRKSVYKDDRGYLRWKHDGYLCHRDIARAQCLSYKTRTDGMRFKDLQVHHVDGNKLNNDPRNLEPCSPREHMIVHGILLEIDGKMYRRVGKESWIKVETNKAILIGVHWYPMSLVLFRGGSVYVEEWFYRKNMRRKNDE